MKEGKCKCGKKYLYIGLDLGYCTKCLDAMEKEDKKGWGKPIRKRSQAYQKGKEAIKRLRLRN